MNNTTLKPEYLLACQFEYDYCMTHFEVSAFFSFIAPPDNSRKLIQCARDDANVYCGFLAAVYATTSEDWLKSCICMVHHNYNFMFYGFIISNTMHALIYIYIHIYHSLSLSLWRLYRLELCIAEPFSVVRWGIFKADRFTPVTLSRTTLRGSDGSRKRQRYPCP